MTRSFWRGFRLYSSRADPKLGSYPVELGHVTPKVACSMERNNANVVYCRIRAKASGRERASRYFKPGTPGRNEHETSLDRRRHGRGPRDRRPRLGANFNRADDATRLPTCLPARRRADGAAAVCRRACRRAGKRSNAAPYSRSDIHQEILASRRASSTGDERRGKRRGKYGRAAECSGAPTPPIRCSAGARANADGPGRQQPDKWHRRAVL